MLKEFYHCYYSISFVLNVMLDRIWADTKFAVGSVETLHQHVAIPALLKPEWGLGNMNRKDIEKPDYQGHCKIVNLFLF